MTLWRLVTGRKPEPTDDEPEPVEPEVQPDEDFTREDFMRDLRKFVPRDNEEEPEN
jgi:hypothetical protein